MKVIYSENRNLLTNNSKGGAYRVDGIYTEDRNLLTSTRVWEVLTR